MMTKRRFHIATRRDNVKSPRRVLSLFSLRRGLHDIDEDIQSSTVGAGREVQPAFVNAKLQGIPLRAQIVIEAGHNDSRNLERRGSTATCS